MAPISPDACLGRLAELFALVIGAPPGYFGLQFFDKMPGGDSSHGRHCH